MNLYHLSSVAQAEANNVVIPDKQHRIAGYFIWNSNDGEFLKFSELRGVAQDGLSESQIAKSDFLNCVISVPIFSGSACGVFKREIPSEFEFHEISVASNGKSFTFYLAKCSKYRDVLDKQSSEYRPLTDGTLILSKAVFVSTFADDFYIARDRDDPTSLVATEKFVDLCERNGLRIDFVETLQN